MAFNYSSSPLRDESRSFPKAEGFNPQGCSYFLDDHKPCSYDPGWPPSRTCRPLGLPPRRGDASPRFGQGGPLRAAQSKPCHLAHISAEILRSAQAERRVSLQMAYYARASLQLGDRTHQAASAYAPGRAVPSSARIAACNIRTSMASIDSEIVKGVKDP